METSLHRALKDVYARGRARTEVAVQGYRADVLRDGEVVEIQASPLGAIAGKVSDLLKSHRVLVVKPIARHKYILRQSSAAAGWDRRRLSPKKGRMLDVFHDLVRFTRVFPHPNLRIEVVLVDEEELRVPRRRRRFRRPDFRVVDRKLQAITARTQLATGSDLAALLPPQPPNPFTTKGLAQHLDCPPWLARMVAYTLRQCGVTRVQGKERNWLVYEWIHSPQTRDEPMLAC